ncbi:MAG: LysM peptidoglycan-binding domain-containing protein [Clostridia bacterium]|nr:LysM peptidoglycan-binding domain-containing protein [Clostridia bacterium]
MEQKNNTAQRHTKQADNAREALCICYIAVQGDTLSTVASRFNVSEESLLRLNRIENALLEPGRRLLIPLG